MPTSTILTNKVQAVVPARSVKVRSSLPFILVSLYLLFEFGRPQDAQPVLGAIQLPMISLICLGIQLAKYKALKFTDRTTKLFVALLVFMLFHVPFAVNNYWAFHTARAMALTFVGYLGVLTFVDSAKVFKMLINVWLAIHTYLAVWGLMHGGVGVGGWIGDQNDFCLALNMVLPYAYFRTFSEDNPAKKVLNLGMVVLFLAAIMATFSRGGFLGLIAVGLYCWFRSPRKVIATLVVVLFAVFVLNFAPKGYWEEMSTIQEEYSGETKGTGAGRKYAWAVGWKMFLANPIFGVGQGNFPWQFSHYEGEETYEGASQAGRAAHSLYYTLMPELGLLGILLFLSMIYYFYKDLTVVKRVCNEKHKRAHGAEARFLLSSVFSLEASLVAFLASGYFVSVLYYPCFWILLGFAVALRKVALGDEAKSPSAH